jgi:anti-sigma factor RsiW
MSELFSRARFWRDHRWTPGHMSAYLDGELAARRRTRLERHTADCPECRRVLAGLRQMLDVLARLPAAGGGHAAPIAASVRTRLDEPPPP